MIATRDSSGGNYKEVVSTDVIQHSLLPQTQLYLRIFMNRFHIGYDGQQPFITMGSEQELYAVASVQLEGRRRPCSCEEVNDCTTDVIDSFWTICDRRKLTDNYKLLVMR